jgi:hypothetical protein
MRCRRCQRSISGPGKPAVPPVIPALVAFAGGLGGLWSLTLGQDPSNALPHWSPVSGWALGLGSLALASVLAWIGLVRRRCPDCGSSQMFDAMEEESVIASERLAAQKAAVEEARIESRSSHDKDKDKDKEMTDNLAAREKELRSTLEQELRTRLIRELAPQVEHDVRGRVEKELRVTLGNEFKSESAKSRAQIEKELRPLIEQEVRREFEQRLRTNHEQRSSPAARVFTSSVTPGPATPTLTTTAKSYTSPSRTQVLADVKTPHAAVPATAAKDVTPLPVRPFSTPHPRVETAPLSLISSPEKARIGSKGPVAPLQAPPQETAAPVAPSSDHAGPGK